MVWEVNISLWEGVARMVLKGNILLVIVRIFLFGRVLRSRKPVSRWFKFTLKPPYTIAHGNLLLAIWDTSHWTSFVKFGLKTA